MTIDEIWISFLILALCGCQLFAIIISNDFWPFGAGDMYAHYIDPGMNLFDMKFIIVCKDGQEIDLDPQGHLGIHRYQFLRIIFYGFYGSTNHRHPKVRINTKNDNAKSFQLRMDRLCEIISELLKKRRTDVKALEIQVLKLRGPGNLKEVLETRTIKKFEVKA